MPRTPIEDDPRYVKLATVLADVDQTIGPKIVDLKNQIELLERKISFGKSLAMMQALKSGLSVYAVAKAAGVKSSSRKATLEADCQQIIDDYYGKV